MGTRMVDFFLFIDVIRRLNIKQNRLKITLHLAIIYRKMAILGANSGDTLGVMCRMSPRNYTLIK